MVPDYWFLVNQSQYTNESWNVMILKYYFLKIYLEVICWIMHSFLSSYNKKINYNRVNPIYYRNKQLTHTLFPKTINTPETTLEFIGFVAFKNKNSVILLLLYYLCIFYWLKLIIFLFKIILKYFFLKLRYYLYSFYNI